MKLKSVRRIEPKLSRCISVDAPDRLFAAGGMDGRSFISHNSVIQRNIIFGAILRPDSWRFIGIDLKKVELSAFRAYSNVVLGIATELEDALTVLRFGQATMMKRYQEMEALGMNDFINMPNHGPALMIMVDEAGELLSPSGVKALAGSTKVWTPSGLRCLEELQVGDKVIDPAGEAATIERKYIPAKQDAYRLSFKSTSTGAEESFVAGAEHWWVVQHGDQEKLLTTQQLKELFDGTPEDQRSQIRFKRSKLAPSKRV